MPRDGITDDQLLALGRFTWAAMKLEAWADRICEYLLDGSTSTGMIASHVDRVKKALPRPAAADARAIAWLDEVLEVLDRRNAVLHGTLHAFYFGDVEAPASKWEWEQRIVSERRRTSVAFTPDGLSAERDHLEAVHSAGIAIDVSLAAR